MEDLYDILGVNKNSSQEDIKKVIESYRYCIIPIDLVVDRKSVV